MNLTEDHLKFGWNLAYLSAHESWISNKLFQIGLCILQNHAISHEKLINNVTHIQWCELTLYHL